LDSSHFQKNWLPLADSHGVNYHERKQIVIFTTSDDEFLGVSPDWDLPELQSQIEWLTKIAKLAISYQYKVIIRLHPNLRTKSRSLQREWSDLSNLRNLEMIKYNEPINSYNLINQSDLVISCGSTIAMEAGFLGKPVLSVGSGIYDGLHAVTKTQDLKIIEDIFSASDFESLKPIKSRIDVYGFTEMSKFEDLKKELSSSKSSLEFDFFRPSLFNKIVSKIYRGVAFKYNLIHR
jgi:capsule polysaccharide export protein KpsC/LpsZ